MEQLTTIVPEQTPDGGDELPSEDDSAQTAQTATDENGGLIPGPTLTVTSDQTTSNESAEPEAENGAP